MKSFYFFCAFFPFLLLSFRGEAKLPFEEIIHEAFVSPEQNKLIFQAVPLKPPLPLKEDSLSQSSSQFTWIAGYWVWSVKESTYVWVPGVWRRPPPGMTWISGYWKEFEEGWVWFHGFWTKIPYVSPEKQTQFPPSNLNEKLLPAPGRDYFWMGGQWDWDNNSRRYLWQAGHWERFDSQWVYFPGFHYWREDGYYYEGAYWDWPIEERGIAYYFDRKSKEIIALTTEEAVQRCLLRWPDYRYVIQYYVYYFNELLKESGLYLDWWDSQQWWALNWSELWGLWWWWSHPSYPQPTWLDESIASEISPPSKQWIELMSNQNPPPILTPDGATTLEQIWKGIIQVTGAVDGPILPTDPREVEDIQLVAKPVVAPPPPYLRPDGSFFQEGTRQLRSPSGLNNDVPKNLLSTEPLKIPPKPASKDTGINRFLFSSKMESSPKVAEVEKAKKNPPTFKPAQAYRQFLKKETSQVQMQNRPLNPELQPSPVLPEGPKAIPHGRKRPFDSRRSPESLNPSQGNPMPPAEAPLPFMQQDKGDFMQQNKGDFMNSPQTEYGPGSLD